MVLEQSCCYAEGRSIQHILGARHALDSLASYLAIQDHCYGKFS